MDKLDGHWSKISVLEPVTGDFYNRYFYKRQPAFRVVLDTPKANVLAGYVLIEKDLRSAIIWINHIRELLKNDLNFTDSKGHVKSTYNREQLNIVKGLFVAALTFYGKCFTACEGRKVKLEKSNLDEKFQQEHDNAMEFRNNFAAHSGAKKLEQVKTVIALDKNRKAPPYLVRELSQPDTLTINSLNEFLTLFEYVRDFTVQKIETLEDKVYEDILSKGADYWYLKTK